MGVGAGQAPGPLRRVGARGKATVRMEITGTPQTTIKWGVPFGLCPGCGPQARTLSNPPIRQPLLDPPPNPNPYNNRPAATHRVHASSNGANATSAELKTVGGRRKINISIRNIDSKTTL